jgi:glutaminyl-tRNA synthetase
VADNNRTASRDFIRQEVDEDLRTGRYDRVVTRFPPEPNGYLHIGHAKAMLVSAGVAEEYDGRFNLRFDDTNPVTEETRYVDSIVEDVRWLGCDFGEGPLFASDYFERMYALAEWLIGEGHAYVDSQSEEEIRENRGTVTRPGVPSRFRERSAEESLALFRQMRSGKHPDGSHVLRARIDMASENMLLRDPLLYRIRHAHHHRTGDAWCIYPMYDYAHTVEDAIEGITHSLCSLEFEVHRPLYDWVADRWVEFVRAEGGEPVRPRQIEFARLALDYTVMSKRKLGALVSEGRVAGWDDPRMPTLAGLRRRGVTPEAIRAFNEMIGVTKANTRIDVGKLEYAIRDDLNHRAPRLMGVLDPLKVVITNWPEGETETFDAPLWPRDVPREGSRPLPFSGEVWIDRDDFREDPPAGFRRLVPGGEVRLRYAYVIRCDEVVRGDDGAITELRCSYLPETRGGANPEGRRVKGTIHWVSAAQAVPVEVRLYDRLFRDPDPEAHGDFHEALNPDSLRVVPGALVEPAVAELPAGEHVQLERVGYFFADPEDSRPGRPVLNRTVTLRDAWSAREEAGGDAGAERKPAARPEPSAQPGPAGAPQIPERSPALQARRERYEREMEVDASTAEVLTREEDSADLFESGIGAGAPARPLANWIVHELPRELDGREIADLPFAGPGLAALVRLVEEEVVSSSGAREVLAEMVRSGGDPEAIVDRKGLRQVSDESALEALVDEALAANPGKVEAYRGGQTGLLGFFMGQVMRASGGSANPQVVREILAQRLG